MIKRTAGRSSVKRTALFAYAAGATGILANLFLFLELGLQARRPEAQTSPGSAIHLAGSASDLVGSLATAFMIAIALFLGGHLPQRRAARFTQAAGLTAMVLLTVGGLLVGLGVLAFEVVAPITVAAWMVLSLWLLLVNRWLRMSDAFPVRLSRLGEYLGAGMLTGAAVVGLGLLLPWMSWVQLVVFGVGVVLGVVGWLGIPIWFVILGRHLAAS
jgi:hypothetical protein